MTAVDEVAVVEAAVDENDGDVAEIEYVVTVVVAAAAAGDCSFQLDRAHVGTAEPSVFGRTRQSVAVDFDDVA